MKEIFIIQENLFQLIISDFAFGQLAAFTQKSPEKIGTNEDAIAAFSINETTGVLALADGVGGQRNAAEAATSALKTLGKKIQHSSGKNLREAILDAFEEANKKIIDMGVGAGSTLAVVELQNGKMRAYHVGDSSIVCIGQKGALVYKNTLHSPVGYALEAGVIDQNEALHHEDVHIILNVLGNTQMMIELGPQIELRPKDSLLLASDGLTDNLPFSEIAEKLRKGKFEDTAQEFIEDCIQLMKSPVKADDLSFLLFRLKS